MDPLSKDRPGHLSSCLTRNSPAKPCWLRGRHHGSGTPPLQACRSKQAVLVLGLLRSLPKQPSEQAARCCLKFLRSTSLESFQSMTFMATASHEMSAAAPVADMPLPRPIVEHALRCRQILLYLSEGQCSAPPCVLNLPAVNMLRSAWAAASGVEQLQPCSLKQPCHKCGRAQC